MTRKYDTFLFSDSDFICNFIAVRRLEYVGGNVPVVEWRNMGCAPSHRETGERSRCEPKQHFCLNDTEIAIYFSFKFLLHPGHKYKT